MTKPLPPEARRIHRGDPLARFWTKVDRRGPDDCWLWTGATAGPQGHAVIWWDGRNSRASHVAVYLATGRMPSYVLHTCDTPRCVNAAHLRPGTHAENMADMAAKGRAGRQVLGPADVAGLLAELASGTPVMEAARRFGVSPRRVRQLRSRSQALPAALTP